MRTVYLLVWNLLFTVSAWAWTIEKPDPAAGYKFVRNDNQWEKGVLYRADLPGGFLLVRQHALQYVFYDTKAVSDLHLGKRPTAAAKLAGQTKQDIRSTGTRAEGIRAHGFQVTFAGANPAAMLEALHATSEKRNYFLGKDPARWASEVPAFTEIVYRNLYPGIDFRLYTHHNSLKYELVVSPGADASQIKFEYSGADEVALRNNEFVVRTSVNTVTETPPYCYQRIDDQQREVASRFDLRENVLSFRFPKGYRSNYPLVIDPILVFSTFSGSVADNWGHCATYDEQGNLYSGGTVFGADFPFTPGAFQVGFGGSIDVGVLKYNATGTELLYATFLGGAEAEVPHSMTVNKQGELLMMGTTSSLDFPIAANAPFKTFGGGFYTMAIGGIDYSNGSDLFVSKFSADGSQLSGSTYLGGSNNDGLKPLDQGDPTRIKNYGDQFRSEVISDENDNVYVATTTASQDFPVINPVQAVHPGDLDALIFRLNASLSALAWSTYFGGNGQDAAFTLRLGNHGSLYVAGVTTSSNLPTKAGALHAGFGGLEDGFVARFQHDQLVQTTYLGTSDADQAMLIDLDADENVHVLGLSFGRYPVSPGVYSNENSHQFIHALDSTLSRTIFSTVIGSGRSKPDIAPTAFLINECGNIYISGWGGRVNEVQDVQNYNSNTTNLPVTSDAFRNTTLGDDFYIMVLEEKAQSLLYATFFGSTSFNNEFVGNHVDGGTSRFNKKGVIFHAACACGGNGFPTTPGVWSNKNESTNCNNAAFKFDIESLKASFDIYDSQGTKDVLAGCTPFTARFVNTSIGGITYEWDLGGLTTSNRSDETSYTFTQPGEYTIRLSAFNRLTCQRKDVAVKTIKVTFADFKVNGSRKICPGQSASLLAEGGSTYLWAPATGLDNPNIANPVASPTVSTRYKVRMSSANGCSTEKEVLVEVVTPPEGDFALALSDECGKPMVVKFTNSIAGNYSFTWEMGNGDTLKKATPDAYVYTQPGTYEVTLHVENGNCPYQFSRTIRIAPLEDPPNVVTPNGDGHNDTFFLAVKNTEGKVSAEEYQLEMYNRWGKLVYQSDTYRNDWGPGVANGLYYYLLTSPLGTACKGWVQILF